MRIPEKYLLLLHWLCKIHWMWVSQWSVKNSLKEMRISDHLTCFLRNMFSGQEVTVRTWHGIMDWFKTGKGVGQGFILSSCLFNLFAEYIMKNAGLNEAQAGIKIVGRNINNLRHADDITIMAESEELNFWVLHLEQGKKGEWKSWLKTQHSNKKNRGIWSHHFMTNRWWNKKLTDFIFLDSKITVDGDCSLEIKRCLLLGWKNMTNLDSVLKSRDSTLHNKGPYSQSYDFSSSHVWMWEQENKKEWTLKNWCFWTVVLEKTLERPLNSKETKPVNPKENQPWIFIGRTDGETPILWPPDVKSLLIAKDPDPGKDWGQEEKGVTEDEMFGWHHWLNGHEFEQIPKDSEGQGSLACCSSWGCK